MILRRTPRREIALIALMAMGLSFPMSPAAWAQLETVDPALDAALDALIAHDPDIGGNAELAQICRDVAEATLRDPAERAAVTREVEQLYREGVDLSSVIPPEVREAAREEFARVQDQMRSELEALRSNDPEAAREMELMMREGERAMAAFESGERYVPSAEMVSHAREMFSEWETEMVSQGAPPEYLERARMEFARFSSGEMGFMGGPGHDMMGMGGPGPGGPNPQEIMGPGGMFEQMSAQGILTPEQLQQAREMMMQQGPNTQILEQMVASGQMSPEQLEAARGFFDQQHGGEGMYRGGPREGEFRGPGPTGGYMPEGWARDQTGNVHYVGTEGEHVGPMGGPPSLEQMEQMVASGQMTPDQLEMARSYMEGGFQGPGPGGFEHYGPGPGGFEQYGPGPGGFEYQGPGPGGFEYQGPGGFEYQGPGGFEYQGPGGFEFQGPAGFEAPTGGWEAPTGGWEAPTGGWEAPTTGGWEAPTGGWEAPTTSGYEAPTQSWEAPAPIENNYTPPENQNYDNVQQQNVERYEIAFHIADHNGSPETQESHEHTIHVHSDSTRHDHTATSPADTAPGSVYIP